VADIDCSVEDHVAVLRLNRPDVKNAVTTEMADLWADLLIGMADDPEVRVIVVTGEGKAFCGGGDFGRLAVSRPPIESRDRLTKHIHRVALTVDRIDKPLIAAVNGDAFGAGMDMALMCDLRYASRSARFSGGYILAGLVPGDGACHYLPRIVGMPKALELLLFGTTVSAEEAERLGIVNAVVEAEDLMPTVMAHATTLAQRDPVLVQTIKRCVYQSATADLRTSLDLVAAQMAVIRSTPASRRAFQDFEDARRRAKS
jgi:enoyl-CoA hydratase/carnithine racemase